MNGLQHSGCGAGDSPRPFLVTALAKYSSLRPDLYHLGCGGGKAGSGHGRWRLYGAEILATNPLAASLNCLLGTRPRRHPITSSASHRQFPSQRNSAGLRVALTSFDELWASVGSRVYPVFLAEKSACPQLKLAQTRSTSILPFPVSQLGFGSRLRVGRVSRRQKRTKISTTPVVVVVLVPDSWPLIHVKGRYRNSNPLFTDFCSMEQATAGMLAQPSSPSPPPLLISILPSDGPCSMKNSNRQCARRLIADHTHTRGRPLPNSQVTPTGLLLALARHPTTSPRLKRAA